MRDSLEGIRPPQTSAEPDEDQPKEHQIGVLLVHGIGEQPEGGTLLAFGEPLLEWLHRWLQRGGSKEGGVDVVETMLTPSTLDSHAPPHAQVRVAVPQAAGSKKTSWLVAESWWGGDVKAPPFAKLAGWMMTVGAWSILSHVMKRAIGRRNLMGRLLLEVGALLLWFVLAALFQTFVLLLSIFALLPIPGTRKLLSGILLALTGVLGDSYVLLESDFQRFAIVNKTREALRWLAQRCESVVVVAHSQGAAVAHMALRSPEPVNVTSLLTFGSGLGKLEELLRLRRKAGPLANVSRMSPLFLVIGALLTRIVAFEPWNGPTQVAVFGLAFAILAAAIYVILAAEKNWEDVEGWLPELSFATSRPGLTWIDIHASHDPVPNGPLSSLGKDIASRDVSIINVGSVVKDHTSYWQNRISFVPAVLDAIGGAGGIELFDASATNGLRNAAKVHARTVLWLRITSWLTLAAVVLLPVRYWGSLNSEGAMIDRALRAMGGLFEKLVVIPHSILGWATNASELDVTALLHQTLGALLYAALIFLWRLGYRFVWRWWDDRALERVFQPNYLAHPVDRGLIDGIGIAAGVAPLVVVAAWPSFRNLLAGQVIGGTIVLMYALMVILILGQFVLKTVEALPRMIRGQREAWKELKSVGTALAGVLVLVAFILPSFFERLSPLRAIVSNGLVLLVFIGWLVLLHRSVIARLQGLTHGGWVRWTVLGVPAVTSAVLTTLVVRDRLSTSASGGRGPLDELLTLALLPLSLWFFVLGVAWVVLFAARRWFVKEKAVTEVIR